MESKIEKNDNGKKQTIHTMNDIYKDYVPPPPIKVVRETLDEKNSSLPGDIQLDEQGKMLKKYFIYAGIAEFLKEEYDLWITKTIREQITEAIINFKNGNTITFDNISYRKPHIRNMKTGKFEPMTPRMATDRDLSYLAEIDCDFVYKNPQGKVIDRKTSKMLCKVPVMIGSIACHLYQASKEKLLEFKDCIVDPHGYFIVEGIKKTILLQEKLQSNRIVIFYDNTGLIAKMTCVTVRGSTLIHLLTGKHEDIRFNSHFLGKDKSINLFSIFRILGVSEMERIMAMIFQFTPHKKAIENRLAQTQAGFYLIYNDFDEIRLINPKYTDKVIKDYAFNELFPQIQTKDRDPLPKLQMLALMTARYLETQIGMREMDDRDSWANKRLVGPARNVERLFGRSLHYRLSEIQEKIEEGKIITHTQVYSEIENDVAQKMTLDFVSSFRGNSWGIKGHYSKENITDILKGDSPLAIYSQLLRVNTPVNRKNIQSTVIRMVRGTQARYIDIVKTPEGATCGIVKYCAITARTSLERSDLELIDSIQEYIYGKSDDQHRSIILVNGKLLGWCSGITLRNELIQRRRTGKNGKVALDTGIFLDQNGYGMLMIFTNGERPVVPMLIIDEETQTLVMDKNKNLLSKNYTFQDLLRLGMAEYLDPLEAEYSPTIWNTDRLDIVKRDILKMQEDLKLTMSALDFAEKSKDEKEIENIKNDIQLITGKINKTKKMKYTHCDVDPTSILGVSASLIPFLGHNQGPRDVLQCSQGDQAVSTINSNHMSDFEKTSKALAFPTRPLVETQMNTILGFEDAPSSINAVVMNGHYKGYTQEDAFVFKKEAIERGLGRYVKYMSYFITVSRTTEYTDEIKKPTPMKGEDIKRYLALNEFGIARIGAYVNEGDYIIGKIRSRKEKVINKITQREEEIIIEENLSEPVGRGDVGVVDSVLISFNEVNQIIVKLKIRDVRSPSIGDKFTISRYGQKGTIGLIVPEIDLPRTKDGISPDIIHNPHALPSRMTIGLPMEYIFGKSSALTGRRPNATPFRSRNFDEHERTLVRFGFQYNGDEVVYSGITGEIMHGTVFIGPVAIQELKHHARDKKQARGTGKRMLETGQPSQGRARFGAIRFGEQERDAGISHGASAWIKERLCDVSDAMKLIICTTCHHIAISTDTSFVCNHCLDKAKFGVLTIPTVFKLIIQHLKAANIDLGLITEEKHIG